MEYLQRDFLLDQACETFQKEFLQNEEFQNMIHMIYFDAQELWEEKEFGKPNEQALLRIFSWLSKENLEETCKSPVNVAWFLQKQYKEKNK